MCWLSRRNHLYIPRSHPTECVYCSAQSFCFLEKQNFLFTSFNFKKATWMRLSSTHVMKMTWKQNRVRRHLGDKMFSTVAKSVSGSQCLCSTKFVFLSQEHTDIQNTHKHDFLNKKIISEEKLIISTLGKYCAFIFVNFILYFNECTNRLRADSFSLNCILVVREKTNTAYFYILRKAEVSISTYHDYSSGKEADWLTQFMPYRPVTGSAR